MVVVQNQNSRKYNLNFSYFKKWSPVMSYLLGYIFAEGNLDISKFRGHRVALQVESTDKDMISLLNKELNLNQKLKWRHRKNKSKTYYTTICSKEIGNNLMKLGVIPRKNTVMKLPDIPKKYFKEFVKGYFRGDGGVANQKSKKQVRKYINKKGGTKIYKYNKKTYIYPILKFTSNSKNFLIKLNKRISSSLNIKRGGIYKKGKNSKGYSLVFSIVPTRKILKWFGIEKKRI